MCSAVIASVSNCKTASLKVVTYNLFNLNDRWPERKMLIAEALHAVDADIIGFQEVHNAILFIRIFVNQWQ
jgi:hypothetical protein